MIATAVALTGCATRWQPQTEGRVVLSEACSGRRAPAVEEFGASGLRGVYHFVTQDASSEELGTLIRGTETQGFRLAFMTVNINGLDTIFAHGPALLRSQGEVDAEFRAACGLGHGRVYLTHVRYNAAEGEGEYVRAR